MSMQTDAYQLCKTVWSSSPRDQLRDLISAINTPRDGLGSQSDRSHLGYIARQLGAQLLGYLVVDRDRAKLEEATFTGDIPQLSPQERRLLESTHRQILRLNSQCVEGLTKRLPKCATAVDPYTRFHYVLPDDTPKTQIFAPEAAHMIAASFREHPAVLLALETAEPFYEGITEGSYAEQVFKLTDGLLRAGVSRAPQGLGLLVTMESKDSPNRVVARHLGALICVRASIATLDQLIYQAILSNRLPILNDANMIEIRYRTKHLCGTGISVIYQPDEQAGIEDLLTLFLIRCPPYGIPATQLCQVETLHVEASLDFGETVEVGLREIDHNLNPFGPLLDHL